MIYQVLQLSCTTFKMEVLDLVSGNNAVTDLLKKVLFVFTF